MKTIIHVYPNRREALDDMSKVQDKEAIVNFPVMFIDFLKERHIYVAGTAIKAVTNRKPDKFIIHDRERCYGGIIRKVREISYLNKIAVDFV